MHLPLCADNRIRRSRVWANDFWNRRDSFKVFEYVVYSRLLNVEKDGGHGTWMFKNDERVSPPLLPLKKCESVCR